MLLYLGLLALLPIVIGLAVRLGIYARDHARMETVEAAHVARIAEQQAEIEAFRVELDAAVQERLPRLTPIALDEAIPINERYVRSVMFMMTRKVANSGTNTLW